MSERVVESEIDLDSILTAIGKTVDDIEKIYHGKDHHCRCGCGGNYYQPGEKGFTAAVNKMRKKPVVDGEMDAHLGYGTEYINIPTDSSTKYGKCYCIYFK